MRIAILEPDQFPGRALLRLRAAAEVEFGVSPTESPGIEAVFVRLGRQLDAGFHARYPDLRWIVSPTTGLNHIDTAYFARHGIHILSLRGRTDFLDTIHATAELTLATTLALLRALPAADGAVRAGRWDRYPHKGRELHGKSVLVYGYGRVGRQVAGLYAAFGCRVVAHDIVEGRVPDELRCDLASAVSDTAILSIHVPLDPSTERLIDAAFLARLPSHALVINTARGEVVDQPALFDALENRRLGGAALDVLVGEPHPLDPAIRTLIDRLGSRIVVTPHIGGFTHESLEAVENYMTGIFLDATDSQR